MNPTTVQSIVALVDGAIDDLVQEIDQLLIARSLISGEESKSLAMLEPKAADALVLGETHHCRCAVDTNPLRATKGTKAAPARKCGPKKLAKRKQKVYHDLSTPRVPHGRLPSKGVEQHVCETDAERVAKVKQLREQGYTRTAPNAPLAPGLFDVIERGGTVAVLWREKEAA